MKSYEQEAKFYYELATNEEASLVERYEAARWLVKNKRAKQKLVAV